MKLHLQNILKELQPYRQRKVAINPKHAALLVIDMQNYFQRMIQPVLENISGVIQACRQKNIPIVFTQHGHTDPSSDSGALGQWWGEVILRGTKDWEFLPEIKIDTKDTILPKNRYSAFYETQLESILQSKSRN